MLMARKLGSMLKQYYMTLEQMTRWSRGLEKSHEKGKLWDLHYHSAYGHQTWQDVDLP